MEIVVFIIIALVIFGAFGSIWHSKKINEEWEAAANRLGLHYAGGEIFSTRKIYGQFKGFSVIVDTFSRSSGKSSTTYTRYRISYPSLGLGLRITRQGFFSGVSKFFGAQDIESNDAMFDKSVIVKGRSEENTINFLTSERRSKIRVHFISYPDSVMEDSKITVEIYGIVDNANKIVSCVKSLAALASDFTDTIEDITPTRHVTIEDDQADEKAEEIVDLANEGKHYEQESDTNPPTETITIEPEEIKIEEPAHEKSGHADTGDKKECVDVEKKSVEPVLEPIEKEVKAETKTEAQDQPQPATSDTKLVLDVGEFIQTIFDPKRFGTETDKLFDSQFKGKIINWKGKLYSAELCSYDPVFGSVDGVKATLEIGEAPTLFGKTKAFAVILQPKGELNSLKESIGKEYNLTGRLQKVDGFMSSIYITSAILS